MSSLFKMTASRLPPDNASLCFASFLSFLCRYSALSQTKSVGMTIETRPDYCLKPHLR